MSKTKDFKRFLKAVEDVRNDYVCKICLELCKSPVTLSKCFHMICGEHFEGLSRCPECNASLEGATTFQDDRLESSIDCTKKLGEMLKPYTTTDFRDISSSSLDKKAEPRKSSSKVVKKAKKQESLLNVLINSPVFDSDEKENEKNAQENIEHPEVEAKRKNSTQTTPTSKANKAAEKRNAKGETLLHIACRQGKIEKVHELLNQGAITNTKDHAGWTPLHEVVQNGRLDLLKLLLQHNALINVPGNDNETPLHEAVRYAQANDTEPMKKVLIAIVEELVKNGADLNARNSRGETPLSLATPAMKVILANASENLIQTQGVNLTHISELHSELDFDEIRVYCVSQFKTVHSKLRNLVKNHSNLHFESKFSTKVTHLIVDTESDLIAPSSLDVLQGIVNCIWILSTEWITKSTGNKLERFEDYEVKGVNNTTYNGPKKARFNKYKQHPGLFDGCHFYLHNFTNSPYEITKSLVVTKQILTKLITDADGVVLRRVANPESIPDSEKLVPYHANRDGKLANCSHYIIFKDIYEPMYNMSHLKALPIGWLIECIEKYELCEPDFYFDL